MDNKKRERPERREGKKGAKETKHFLLYFFNFFILVYLATMMESKKVIILLLLLCLIISLEGVGGSKHREFYEPQEKGNLRVNLKKYTLINMQGMNKKIITLKEIILLFLFILIVFKINLFFN